jgi:hypothetical protein
MEVRSVGVVNTMPILGPPPVGVDCAFTDREAKPMILRQHGKGWPRNASEGEDGLGRSGDYLLG